ncbi:AI-2E family transporter [Flavobacterium sp. SM15]|uniref:AI-2E family transporter n=1 Tax=Flavobacterium sp. SM15 TaxID=2908005 RepID=UPI001EDA4442|nr:AI-2E family transporter [Flavobacterium sp. SM15]MCG2612535.1 AI-2E family transporter [Flavobacterium sp. SM15]
MKTSTNNSQLAYNLFCFIAIVLILYFLKPFIVPLLFAILFSIMMYPVAIYLERKWRFNRIASSLSVVLLLLIIFVGLFTFIGFQIKDVIGKSDLYSERLTELNTEILQYTEDHFGIDKKQLLSDKSLKMENLIKNNFSRISDFVTESGSFLSDIFLVPIYIFFLLLYRKFFVAFVHRAFPKKDNAYLNIILKKIYQTQQNYLSGLSVVMLIVALLNSSGLLLLGIENAFFYGFLGALLLLIPYIGIIVGSLIPALIALITKDSVWYSVGVIGVFAFVQIIEGNFITPKITGSKISVNAFSCILALVIFALLWGIAGMVLALPVTATIKIIFDQIPSLKPYGFLMGEPEKDYLRSTAYNRLAKWKRIRTQKKNTLMQ